MIIVACESYILVLCYVCKNLEMAQELCHYYCTLYQKILVMAQNLIFIWYDPAYANNFYSSTKFELLWYNAVYLMIFIMAQNFSSYGMIQHAQMIFIATQSLSFMV